MLESRALLATLATVGPQVDGFSTDSESATAYELMILKTEAVDVNATLEEEEDPTYDGGVDGPLGPDAFMAACAFTPGDTSDKATSEEATHALDVLWPLGAIDVSDSGTTGQEAQVFGKEFQKERKGDVDAQEAARHALWQAMMTILYGKDKAQAIGDIHETYGDKQGEISKLPFDSARDQWNNDKGRKIGEQVLSQPSGFFGRDREVDAARIQQLIREAWDRGDFITGKDDERIKEQNLIEQERLRAEQQRAHDEEVARERMREREQNLLFRVIP